MGFSVLRVGTDTAGGLITGPGVPSVLVNGFPISVDNDNVADHGSGAHNSPNMISGSLSVYAGGRRVCRAGDVATCGHVGAPGSLTVLAG